MSADEKTSPTASEYILDNFAPNDRIAILVLNRERGETTQRITTAQKAASPEFQAWLRYKNANGADIYVGMNPLKEHASTRTKEDVARIGRVYLDLDHGGTDAVQAIANSGLVPTPNYIVNTSPEKFQVTWKVDGLTMDEAEALNHALVNEFGGDPAATDAARVLRLPGFANKKYGAEFYVHARAESTQTYHLHDFKLEVDLQGSARRQHQPPRHPRPTSGGVPSQSERDWAYAKRALSRGDDPEEVIRRIADFRTDDKQNPEDYAQRTVTKAQLDLEQRARAAGTLDTQQLQGGRDEGRRGVL